MICVCKARSCETKWLRNQSGVVMRELRRCTCCYKEDGRNEDEEKTEDDGRRRTVVDDDGTDGGRTMTKVI